jgi:hypothetical protein
MSVDSGNHVITDIGAYFADQNDSQHLQKITFLHMDNTKAAQRVLDMIQKRITGNVAKVNTLNFKKHSKTKE